MGGGAIISSRWKNWGTHNLWHNAGAAYHWAMWPVSESDVKLQYKLAQTRPANIARMRDDPTSVIGRYHEVQLFSFSFSCLLLL